jgi:hypothetical protein
MEEINNYNDIDNNNDNTFFLKIKKFVDFIIDKHKQLFLLLLAFIIIFIVDYITYYNNLLYSVTPMAPNSQQIQKKSNILNKKKRK